MSGYVVSEREEEFARYLRQTLDHELASLRVEYEAQMGAALQRIAELERQAGRGRDTEPAPPPHQSWSGAEVVPRGSSNPPPMGEEDT